MIKRNQKKMIGGRYYWKVFLIGVVMAGVSYMGTHNLLASIFALVQFGAFGLWLNFGRSDLVDTIRQKDERQQYIVRKTREYTALVMCYALICGAVIEIISGKIGGPFLMMASFMGVVFLVIFLVLRART